MSRLWRAIFDSSSQILFSPSQRGTFAFACHQSHQFQLDVTAVFICFFTCLEGLPLLYNYNYIYKGKNSFALCFGVMSLLKLRTLMTCYSLLYRSITSNIIRCISSRKLIGFSTSTSLACASSSCLKSNVGLMYSSKSTYSGVAVSSLCE